MKFAQAQVSLPSTVPVLLDGETTEPADVLSARIKYYVVVALATTIGAAMAIAAAFIFMVVLRTWQEAPI